MTRKQPFGRLPHAAAVWLAGLGNPAAAESWDAVRAIFEDRCIVCHSGEFAPLGLELDSHAGVMRGSENGPVVVVADPETSPILRRLIGADEPRMPLDGPPWLDAAQLAAIETWISAGAPGADAPDTGPDPIEAPPADPYADGVVYSEVAQIFKQRCIECHSDNSKLAAPPEGLRLGTLADIRAGGDRVALIPGNAQASEIIRRVEGFANPRMPLDGPPWLTREQIDLLRAWIDGGALDDDMAPAPAPVGGRVRLRGILTAADQIDGARFTIGPDTRIDDRPAIGTEAELRGRIAPDGSILAERLRGR